MTTTRRERELEVILNSTHDAMIAVDRHGRITLFNAAAERLTQIRAVDALDQPVEEVISSSRLPLVLQTGESELNRRQRLHDITIITNRMPVRDDKGEIIGAVAVFRDITDVQTLAEEISNLTEVQTWLKAVINSTQDAISVVDAEGNGLLINPAYTRLTGLTEEDVIAKPATVDIAEGESMHQHVLRTGRPVRGVPMKVGPRRKEVLVNAAPVIIDDSVRGSVAVVHDVSEIYRLMDELERVKSLVRRLEAKYTFDEIVAVSPVMNTAVEQAQRAAITPVTVLLRGESGTGKELFAHAIHRASKREEGPFVRVNCAAFSDSLLESQLFGYVEGAFTGALRGGKRGLFEEANGGTIFLDEVGLMNTNLQMKLLRVLQEKELIRVGDTKPVPVDTRIIGATNMQLEQAVARGEFREDLYYRLNVVPIFIPPLRERKEDFPQLVHHLIRNFNQEYGRNVERCSPKALEKLISYSWPGNVRELENILGRAIIHMSYQEHSIELHHLPLLAACSDSPSPATATPTPSTRSLRDAVEHAERQAITSALQASKGNRTRTAQLLGISPRTLYYKLEKLGLQ